MKKSASLGRALHFIPGYLAHAEGSCLIRMGRTEVLCVATVEEGAPDHARDKGNGWVTAEYAMLPRAGERRTARSKAASGGRAQEISRLIGRALRAAVDLGTIGDRTITVDCDVIRADGGTRTAAINGGFVALAQALLGLHRNGTLTQRPLRTVVSAVSIGLSANGAVVDMSYEQDKVADVDLNLVMTEDGRLVEVQGTAEGQAFSPAELNRLVALGRRATAAIAIRQRKALGRLPLFQ